jgi:hypothetical protein
MMAKSPSGKKADMVFKEWGKGQLHSGSKTGPKVPDTRAGQRQAIAIALSSQRKANAKKGK